MIIKPKRRGGFKQFSDYLQGEAGNDQDNEAVNLISDSLGLKSINDFCILTSKIAAPKQVGKYPLKKPIEHISIRTRKGDILTTKAMLGKVPELLKKLGYQDCPWLLVQHIKDGEPHYHLGILRITSTGTVPNPKSEEVCFDLAQKFASQLGFKPSFVQASGDRHSQQKAHLSRLWAESEGLSPKARLPRFHKGGFTPARGDRGQLIFVDRLGKPHSLHRIPSLKERGLKQADFPAAFGLDSKRMARLPTLKEVKKNIRRTKNVRRTTNKIIRSLGNIGRVYQNALSPMRRGPDLGNRGQPSGIPLLAFVWGLSRVSQRDELRPVRGTGDRYRKLSLQPSSASLPRPRRLQATKGWWVAGRAAGVYADLIAAGYNAEDAEAAAARVYEEEAQRMEAEQIYLDWLQGANSKRGKYARVALSDRHVAPS